MQARGGEGGSRALPGLRQGPISRELGPRQGWGWRGSGALSRAVLTDCPPPTRRAGATQTQQLHYPRGEPGESLGLEPQEEDHRDRLKMPSRGPQEPGLSHHTPAFLALVWGGRANLGGREAKKEISCQAQAQLTVEERRPRRGSHGWQPHSCRDSHYLHRWHRLQTGREAPLKSPERRAAEADIQGTPTQPAAAEPWVAPCLLGRSLQ